MSFNQHKWAIRTNNKKKNNTPTRDEISSAINDFLEQGGTIQKFESMYNEDSGPEAFPEMQSEIGHILESEEHQISVNLSNHIY